VRGDTKKVLIVDDDASIRLLCRVNLEFEGFDVLEAATLTEAWAHLEAEAVAVVLLDLHVGRDDGYSLLHKVREQGLDVRIALLSGSVERVDSSLADAVMSKPFTLDTLTGTVHALASLDSAP
jgi:DNA-binding response OmpR family regulator